MENPIFDETELVEGKVKELFLQIYKICKEHKIPMLFLVCGKTTEEGAVMIHSLTDRDCWVPPAMEAAEDTYQENMNNKPEIKVIAIIHQNDVRENKN
jgi:hypothetical protein